MKICIAGQNNLAIHFTEFVLNKYPNITLCACLNKIDDGNNLFHRSFKSFCLLNKIPIKKIEDLYNEKDLFFFSLGFDQIIQNKRFLSNKLFNIHFSLLPEYKGLYTAILPILHGKDYSGVTLHKIDGGIVTGEIIAQKKFNIYSESYESLYNLYTKEGLKLLKKYLPSILSDKYLFHKQNSYKSTYYSKNAIDFSNFEIDLNKTAFEINGQIRAFFFPFKHIPTIFGQKVYGSEILNNLSINKPGSIVTSNDIYFIINTIDYQIKIFKYKIDELTQSAISGNIEILKHYNDLGYDIKKKNSEGRDLLMVATFHGNLELIKFLVDDIKWDVNTCNYNGTTYLMYSMTRSSKTNDFSILDFALKQKIKNKNVKDYKGLNVFDYALKLNNRDVISRLVKFGCKQSK